MSNVVPEGWDRIPLTSICFFQEGPGLRSWQYRQEGVKFINIRCIKDGDIDTSIAQHLSLEDAEEKYRHFLLDEGDYVLSSSGTIGRLALVKKWHLPLLLNTSVIRFRSLDETKLDNFYLRHFLQSKQFFDKISEQSQGSAQVNFGPTHLKLLDAVLPPISEQKKIATTLNSVDEVIEHTQKQIDKLQDLKKATMNELLTKGIGHTQFKDSELGRIPKSWEVRRIGDLGNVVTGSTPSTTNIDFYNGQYLFVSPADISESMFVSETGKKLSLKGLENIRQIPNKSIMVVCIGSIGKVAITTVNCATNQQINSIVPKGNDPYFIYFAMRWMAPLIKKAVGTSVVPLLNKTDFSNLFIPLPPKEEQHSIGSALHSLNVGIEKLSSKLNQTQSLKKSLMQDLLTGKVRV